MMPSYSRFVCEICNRGFTLHSTMKKHVITHSKKEKNIICQVCSKPFAEESALQFHMAIHTGKISLEPGRCGTILLNAKKMFPLQLNFT